MITTWRIRGSSVITTGAQQIIGSMMLNGGSKDKTGSHLLLDPLLSGPPTSPRLRSEALPSPRLGESPLSPAPSPDRTTRCRAARPGLPTVSDPGAGTSHGHGR
eukprot:596367-Hanusia_phi.AAC.1